MAAGAAYGSDPVDPEFWRGRRVFLTGHTGFKGSWLSAWLQRLDAEVAGYALPAATTPSLFEVAEISRGMLDIAGDVRDAADLRRALLRHRPEVVLHLAAQALVRPSYAAPAETYAVNVMGTVNLLEAVRACPDVRAVVVVTSDKCFENREWLWPYREGDPLGGRDPYSSSKACAELVTAAYRESFFTASGSGGSVAVATARAGNVLGGGDWAEERLVPDLVRSILADEPLVLRYPDAVRPWQHVLDPLAGYLLLAQRLTAGPELAGPWNFAPADQEIWTVRRIVARLSELLDRSGEWTPQPGRLPHEASSLRLDASKARAILGWMPRFSVSDTLAAVAGWYAGYAAGTPAKKLVEAELAQYARLVAC